MEKLIINFYGYDGENLKSIGFCANIEHAQFMSDEFNKRGISSIALTSKDSVDKRKEFIDKLQDDKNDLKVIFTVDLFNEGVDIPAINFNVKTYKFTNYIYSAVRKRA